MALLPPSKGELLVDGVRLNEFNYKSWQQRVAHVPQSIYLSDTSIASNIAFGIPEDKIDYARVRDCAERAQVSGVIEELNGGYQALVGERGIRLSGGQKQRIGIARALYKGADVLVLDEATSALDSSTEKLVIDEIERSSDDITLLMVAHRISTLKNCDKIVELSAGKIVGITTYDQFFSKNTLPGVDRL
jgi:ATP-binding cassette subfamily B protein